MANQGAMIAASALTKKFGSLTAVDGISLSVSGGEVLGFLGPNGAGKSTTMKMITGFLPITSGEVRVCGHDVATHPIEIKKRIGYLPEGAPLYGDMTASSFLNFVAEVRGLRGQEKRRKVEAAIAKLELEIVANQPIETLSKGFKRRVGLAQAILHDPEVLILDEPTDGLDPNQKQQVRDLIREMSAGKAIIISTHILEEVEAVCSRAVVIADGRLVFDGTPREFLATSTYHNAVAIHLKPDQLDAAKADIEGIEKVERVEMAGDNSSFLVIPKNGESIIHEVSELVHAKGITVDQLYVERGRLEEVFQRLTLPN